VVLSCLYSKGLASKSFVPTTAYMFVGAVHQKDKNDVKKLSFKKSKEKSNTFLFDSSDM
jgi:hypothetical protein